VLAGSGEPGHQEEAWALALEGVGADPSNHLQLGIAHTVLARVALRRGELAEAEARARRACELLGPFGAYLLVACRLLSAVLRAQGRLAEARGVAERGVQALEAMGGQGSQSVGVHLALAEVCLAQGDSPSAGAAVRQALHCLHTRAADIPELAARERFLHQVPENARTLALARQCGG
jgi:eukaryotic-like serine/threonine-protein kinase